MKAAVLTGLRRIETADVPKPVIVNSNDVLLKVAVVGICGSDVHYYLRGKIGSQVVNYPFIVGHECSAVIEAVGKKVKKVKVGDEVVVEPAVSCHKCSQCKIGRENTCEKLKFLGTPGQLSLRQAQGKAGCLCEYIVMPEDCCLPTKGRLTFEEGALCEPLAIGIYTIKQARVKRSDKVAILGSGPIGLSCLAAARHKGIRSIYMTDKLDYRVEFAKKIGARWSGRAGTISGNQDIQKSGGVDVVCECAGQQETVDEAFEILRPGGKLMLVGIPPFERFSFAADKIRRKEITIYNVRRQNRCTAEAMKLAAQKRLNPPKGRRVNIGSFVTHRFKLEQAGEALEMVADYRDGVIKAMIEL